VVRAAGRGEVEHLWLIVVAILGCAGFTQLIGLHSVLGALALGLVFPRGEHDDLVASTRQAIAPVTQAVLLPVYFAVAGMGIDVTGLGRDGLVELAMITALATAAKLGGTASGARWVGLPWRDGLPLGILMNTRGLMEIVVLNVGYAVGLLGRGLYSELVLVALVATFMTGPALAFLRSLLSGPIWTPAAVSTLGSSHAA
jgi:Kef-type K+ transport system membrane component KefB